MTLSSQKLQSEEIWSELIKSPDEYNPLRYRWFAWYPVPCHDLEGINYVGWVWLAYVEYELWNGKYYYFYGDDYENS